MALRNHHLAQFQPQPPHLRTLQALTLADHFIGLQQPLKEQGVRFIQIALEGLCLSRELSNQPILHEDTETLIRESLPWVGTKVTDVVRGRSRQDITLLVELINQTILEGISSHHDGLARSSLFIVIGNLSLKDLRKASMLPRLVILE